MILWNSNTINNNYSPFEKQREYTRALNATKLSRMFAKPFLSSLEGHQDGIYSMAKIGLTSILSGDGSGEIRLWNLSTQKTLWTVKPYKTFVKGLTFCPFSPSKFISVGEKQVLLWDANQQEQIGAFMSSEILNGVDHHRSEHKFVTCTSALELWDHSRYYDDSLP